MGHRRPTKAQRRVSFTYRIPGNALLGTGIVVSELEFEVTEAGVPLTQSARIVEWFRIRPPA